jgi:hypothetical protein
MVLGTLATREWANYWLRGVHDGRTGLSGVSKASSRDDPAGRQHLAVVRNFKTTLILFSDGPALSTQNETDLQRVRKIDQEFLTICGPSFNLG